MIVAVCVDNEWGMTFYGKRLSRDREVVRDVMQSAPKVWVRRFSARLFAKEDVTVDDSCLETAGEGELCFIENADILPYAQRIEKIILYRWNRDYPHDREFRLPGGFRRKNVTEFRGHSHETITKEEYVK